MATPQSPETPASAPPKAPPPQVKQDLADLSLDRLAGEVRSTPEKIQGFLSKVNPVNYSESPENQKNSIALVQTYMIILISYATRDMKAEDFGRLDIAALEKILTENKSSIFPTGTSGGVYEKSLNSVNELLQQKDTAVGRKILSKWEEMKQLSQAGLRSTLTPGAPGAKSTPLASTLPNGPVGGGETGAWEKTKDFVSDNKGKIAIAGALGVAAYAAYRLFGGEGSKDESKWFSGITDWKVLTVAGLATAFGLYKFGPDWIKDMADKFKSFIMSEKASTIESEKIKNLTSLIVEYNNKKNPQEKKSVFPEKLIKSKGGMTAKEFKGEDGTLSFIGFKLNSAAGWFTGTSGVLPEGMKQDYEEYQLLLDFTVKKIQEYKIEYTDDTKMDEIWRKILVREGGGK